MWINVITWSIIDASMSLACTHLRDSLQDLGFLIRDDAHTIHLHARHSDNGDGDNGDGDNMVVV